MTANVKKIRDNILLSALLPIPTALVGIVLPLEFLGQVDGFLHYERIGQLPGLYGWSWLLFALFGLCIGLPLALLAAAVSRLMKRSPAAFAEDTGIAIALSLGTIYLINFTLQWLKNAGIAWSPLTSETQWFVFTLCVFMYVILRWQQAALPKILYSMMRFAALAGLPFIIAALPAWLPSASPPKAQTTTSGAIKKYPSIILITMDALAANHCTIYGYNRRTTPYLKRFSRGATVFDRYYANSNFTTSSVNSFLQGVRPWTHRALQLQSTVDQSVADRGLVARLHSAGYETFAVASNVRAAPYHNLTERWFDKTVYEDAERPLILLYPLHSRFPAVVDYPFVKMFFNNVEHVLVAIGVWSETGQYNLELPFSSAQKLVEERDPNKPMFLWVHIYPPHSPYAAPAPFMGQFDAGPQKRTRFDSYPPFNFRAREDKGFPSEYIGRYDEGVAYADAYVGSFLNWLQQKGLYDDSLIVISADHGESFSHGYGDHCGPLLTEDLIHIPLIIKEPGQVRGGRTDVVAEQVDLMPTILDVSGIPYESIGDGKSLRAALHGKQINEVAFSMNFEQSSCFDQLNRGTVAMIEGRWKYVRYYGHLSYPLMPKLEDSLYDLKRDPGENNNVVAAHPKTAARMRVAIEEQMRRHRGPIR